VVKKFFLLLLKSKPKKSLPNVLHRVNMPYVTDRWLGGMLTNFGTIRKSVKKMQSIEKMLEDAVDQHQQKRASYLEA
jgi:small subunit ribosomal protein S2